MRLHPIVLAVGAAAMVAACDRRGTETTEDTAARTAEPHEQALVRVIQAMPEVPSADVYIGQEKAFTSVDFGTITPYKAVAEKEFTVTLKPAGKQEPVLVEAKQGIKSGGHYTILSLKDRDGAARLSIVADDIDPGRSTAGKALVRVIHAAPEAGPVDVATAAKKDDPEIQGVTYGAPSRYQEMEPAEVSIDVEAKALTKTRATQKTSAVAEEAQVQAGKAYTFVVTPGEEAGQPVQVLTAEDPLPSSPSAARVPAPEEPPARP